MGIAQARGNLENMMKVVDEASSEWGQTAREVIADVALIIARAGKSAFAKGVLIAVLPTFLHNL